MQDHKALYQENALYSSFEPALAPCTRESVSLGVFRALKEDLLRGALVQHLAPCIRK